MRDQIHTMQYIFLDGLEYRMQFRDGRMGSREKRENILSTANACFGEERRGAIDGSSEQKDHIYHICRVDTKLDIK